MLSQNIRNRMNLSMKSEKMAPHTTLRYQIDKKHCINWPQLKILYLKQALQTSFLFTLQKTL